MHQWRQTHCKGNSKSSLAIPWWHIPPPLIRLKSRNRCGLACNQSTSLTAGAKTGAQHQLSTMIWSVTLLVVFQASVYHVHSGALSTGSEQTRVAVHPVWRSGTCHHLSCVPVVTLRWCPTSWSPVPSISWTVASSVFTLLTKLLFSRWTHISSDAYDDYIDYGDTLK